MFKVSEKEAQFIKDGYCTLPIQDIRVVDRIAEVFNQIEFHKSKDVLKEALYVSNQNPEFEFNKLVFNSIQQIVDLELNRHFSHYKVVTSHFLSKKPNSQIELQLHQDWSTTDEKKYLSAHIWIPHQDTTIENGTMYVIPNSHTFFDNYRSGSLDIPRIEYNKILSWLTKPIFIKKGEMLVFQLSLFHGSFPNQTARPRQATLIHIMEDNAPLYYYQLNSNDEIDIFSINDESLIKDIPIMVNGGLPDGSRFVKNIGKRKIVNSTINTKDILLKYLRFKIYDR